MHVDNPSGVVNIGAVTARELDVLWTYSVQNVQSYVVRLFSENGVEQYSQTVAAGSSSTIFQNLTPDTPYIAVVEAVSTAVVSSTVGSDAARTSKRENVLSFYFYCGLSIRFCVGL